MIEQSSNEAADHDALRQNALGQNGVTLDDTSHRNGNQLLEKPTEHRPESTPKKPRRFNYQSGSTALSGYTIKRGIGIGGFGEVYFAISDAGKEVALKRIQRNLDVEIRGVSQCLNLKHINLISLWDIRQDAEGESWVVMEYVPGESLRDVLERNPNGVPLEEAQKWFMQILDGVAYLHDHGIVHRDLKPGNIFYDQDENVVKIGDYGLSKFISTSKRDGQTESVGTFHYMAPEIGKGSYGKEIDIYSLGIILCEVLSGRVPFDGESGQEIIMKHLTASPEIEFVDARFRHIIAKALSKDPDHRFSSVQEMIAALDWEGSAGPPAEKVFSSKPVEPTKQNEPPRRSVVDPMFIRDDEPMYIADDEEIQLGEVTDRSGSNRSGSDRAESDQWSATPDGSIRMSNVKTSNHGSRPLPTGHQPVVADQKNVPQAAVPQPAVISSAAYAAQNEPIAHAVSNGAQKVSDWWNGIGATPVKVGLVVLLALFVLFNAQWLVPVSIAVGCLYMIYYAVRSNVASKEDAPHRDATVIRPFSRKECLRMVEDKLRETRLGLPFSEKLAEALGSVMVATVVILVASIVAIGFSGYSLDGSAATLAVFTWISLSTLLAAAMAIFFTKVFESSVGNQWKRRFVMMASGLFVGVMSFGVYQSFMIDSVSFPSQVSTLENLSWLTTGNAGLLRFMTFFAAYFLVIRWWKVGDALRSTQFSVLAMVLHGIVAVGIALLTAFPVIWGLIIGSIVSIAVQMSSTWIKTNEREQIQFEIMQSVSAGE